MAIDFSKIHDYLISIEKVEEVLKSNQELFDDEKLIEFQQITTSLEQNLRISQQDSRKLSIGIVGAVKAGKSSFLNACIFDGQEFLPKAATPMTAALTRITYSENPKAVIHFYTKEDWDTIEKQANQYDENLRKAYDEYIEQIDRTERSSSYSEGYIPISRMSKEEFEKTFICKSETQRGSKELMTMVKDHSILDKLGQIDEIHGDVISKLNNYVGANGAYTPIVSFVELYVNSPFVKDLDIVDTPGLNDPIVSRGIQTKKFLRTCDVVLLLSPCSQFMDVNTVNLMANSLPNAGVREVLIVGSKLDSGLLNENTTSFALAWKNSKASYETQFKRSITQAKEHSRHPEMIKKISEGSVLYVSSMCYAISQKLKKGETLNSEEQLVYDNLHKFPDFKDDFLSALDNIKRVKDALKRVLSQKAEIIAGKNKDLLGNAMIAHQRVLEKILQEIVSSRTTLETTSADELRQRTSIIRDVIDSSRTKLLYIFDSAIIKCESKIEQIRPQLTREMEEHQSNEVTTNKHTERETVNTGFLGLRKEITYYEVTEHSAEISGVVNNIKQYSAKCHAYINNEFKLMFNQEAFANQIKELVLSAFNKAQREFDEEDILLPLQNVLAKISIPHISIDHTKYIDEIEVRFKKGYAENDEIHQLKSLQSRLLNQIEDALVQNLTEALNQISQTLKKQAVCFADQIEGGFCNELDKLQKQVAEREKYIAEYRAFAEKIKTIKAELSAS